MSDLYGKRYPAHDDDGESRNDHGWIYEQDLNGNFIHQKYNEHGIDDLSMYAGSNDDDISFAGKYQNMSLYYWSS